MELIKAEVIYYKNNKILSTILSRQERYVYLHPDTCKNIEQVIMYIKAIIMLSKNKILWNKAEVKAFGKKYVLDH